MKKIIYLIISNKINIKIYKKKYTILFSDKFISSKN